MTKSNAIKASRDRRNLAICGSIERRRASNRVARKQMKWTKMAAAAVAACLAALPGKGIAEPIELQWWHAMTAVNADRVNKIAADFNASQDAYKIVPVFKG